MWTVLVVPLDPVPNDPPRVLKGLERVLPDTLLFRAPKKSFDHPVLLRRIRRDELLLQTISHDRPVETADFGRSGLQSLKHSWRKACQAVGLGGMVKDEKKST